MVAADSVTLMSLGATKISPVTGTLTPPILAWHHGDPTLLEPYGELVERFESLEAWLLDQAASRPRAQVATALAARVPGAVAEVWTNEAGLDGVTLSHLTRDSRRRLIHGILATPIEVRGSRGYGFAEVTAGGIPLEEIDPARMESRCCPGLYLVGEILDADGRLGGFNFQWAWSSAWIAGRAIARPR